MLLLKTLLKLGLWNIAYVAWYRFTLKSGIRRFWFPTSQLPTDEDFFKPVIARTDYPEEWKNLLLQNANKIINGQIRYYACHWKEIGNPPNWFLNPFNGQSYPNPHLHWTKLPDFNTFIGDIKNIWEASRFEWVVTLARAYAVTSDEKYLFTLNSWLRDWAEKNPLNTGPNWKCGQEASIRVFNLLNAAKILQQETQPTEALLKLVTAHLKRIAPNIRYAIAQDNNHGTSEAAGLFIGGSWIANAKQPTAKSHRPKAKANANLGRYWLENRVKKLISDDGSFSQHSITYHRVMLDTLCYAEYWRKSLNEKNFSKNFYKKAQAATSWLAQFTDSFSGNAPNLGANDGAMLLNLHPSPFRDFRPSIQLAETLFMNQNSTAGRSSEVDYWLGISNLKTKEKEGNKNSKVFKSGYVSIVSKESSALLRFPYFKFRPSHNDVFHFDLWYKGKNMLCDAGSYSYNPPVEEATLDLKSVKSHNTVSFDNQEQMPKISRFLLGNWLKPDYINPIQLDNENWQYWEGQYTDNHQNTHKRRISTNGKVWQIEDTLTGNFKTATIGFNLNTSEAQLEGNTCITPFATIACSTKANANANAKALLTKTIISEHYFQKRTIQRLNYTITHPNTYVTTIHLL